MALALALSGGGFRATLFHLGVIEYLSASGRLPEVKVIASTSGGSIIAGHLVQRWSEYSGSPAAFAGAADDLVRFVSRDVRGHILRRAPWAWASQLLPKRLAKSVRTNLILQLKSLYDQDLYHGSLLSELPAHPRLAIVSTNLSAAALTLFSQSGLEHVLLDPQRDPQILPASLIPVALAVAASSAFPAFFPPLLLTADDTGAEHGSPPAWFTDGGVTDNLALKAVEHVLGESEAETIASDAGRSFEPAVGLEFGFIRTAFRSTDLMMYRMREMELHRARFRKDVRLVSISDLVEVKGAATLAIQQQLESIRTDLDALSVVEVGELRRHGFCCARKTLEGATTEVNARCPPGAKGRASTIARELRAGGNRKLLRSLFSPRELISWLNLILLLALICAAFWGIRLVRNRVVREFQALSRTPIPQYRRGSVPPPIVVSSLARPKNDGFLVKREDRVWDLRNLHVVERDSAFTVQGSAVMTRTTTLARQREEAQSYGFWFETSGEFSAWTLDDEFPLQLRTQDAKVVNGSALVKPWELQVDVSRVPMGRPFQLRVQSESIDAFEEPKNWWIGMSIASEVGVASMRIIFPENLPYKDPAFLKYPTGSAGEAVAFDGTVVTGLDERELLWTVERPEVGYTYKAVWRWSL